jgi:hypothetical protein
LGSRADHIRHVCAASYESKKHCNVYLKEVAKKLGVYLPGEVASDADALLDAFDKQWKNITAAEAAKFADFGVFVVCGLKHDKFVPRKDGPTKHGHVCVVVAGKMGGFPKVFSTNEKDEGAYGKSRGDKPLSGWVFSVADANNVLFYKTPFVLSDTI